LFAKVDEIVQESQESRRIRTAQKNGTRKKTEAKREKTSLASCKARKQRQKIAIASIYLFNINPFFTFLGSLLSQNLFFR